MFTVELVPEGKDVEAAGVTVVSDAVHIQAISSAAPSPLLLRLLHRATVEQFRNKSLCFRRAAEPGQPKTLLDGGVFSSNGYAEIKVTGFSSLDAVSDDARAVGPSPVSTAMDSGSPKMRIQVRLPRGTPKILNVPVDAALPTLRSLACEKLGLEPACQCTIYLGSKDSLEDRLEMAPKIEGIADVRAEDVLILVPPPGIQAVKCYFIDPVVAVAWCDSRPEGRTLMVTLCPWSSDQDKSAAYAHFTHKKVANPFVRDRSEHLALIHVQSGARGAVAHVLEGDETQQASGTSRREGPAGVVDFEWNHTLQDLALPNLVPTASGQKLQLKLQLTTLLRDSNEKKYDLTVTTVTFDATRALNRDGFVPFRLDESTHHDTWLTLSKFLKPKDPTQLGKGKDIPEDAKWPPYNELKLASAWRLENERLRGIYDAKKQAVLEQMKRLESNGVHTFDTPLKGLPTATAEVVKGLPTADFNVEHKASESFLLHSTKASVLWSVLCNGLNERFSGSNAGTAFGDGAYLAEDAAKTDQYGAVDVEYDNKNNLKELHTRLYGESYRHKGQVFYVLICRSLLGYPARTQQSMLVDKNGATERDPTLVTHTDTHERLFATKNARELVCIPKTDIHYHSLIVEAGARAGGKKSRRFREFIFFHGDYILPEYLLAYHRCHNDEVVAPAPPC